MALALIAVNVAACVICIGTDYALMRHFREHHPQLWMRFQPRRDPARDANEAERLTIEAQLTYSGYLRSGEWRKLGDARLAGLVRARRISFYALCLTMTGAGIALLLPHI